MNILYVGSHSILEFDEVRLFASLGHDVFSIGSYTDPANPSDDKRPPIGGLAYHPELAALCQKQREKHAGEDTRYYIDFAKADLHPELLDWTDVVMFAAFPDAWIVPQWARIRHKRVVWRTIGQSDPTTEQYLGPYRKLGLEIVRYSPKERSAFESLNCFAGEDALIRFAKDPADWGGWTGEDRVVGNVTQDMAGRGEFCGLSFWLAGTQDLPAKPAGPKSEALPGGIGALSYDDMRAYLRRCRTYLYTGTQPASYTLGFVEALMTGTPIVAMAGSRFGWPPIYEADEFAMFAHDDPQAAGRRLTDLLNYPESGGAMGRDQRQRAIDTFGVDVIAPQWQTYLGAKVAVAA